jgi:hypothetical protein
MTKISIHYSDCIDNPVEECGYEDFRFYTDNSNVRSNGMDAMDLLSEIWDGKDNKKRRALRQWARTNCLDFFDCLLAEYGGALTEYNFYQVFDYYDEYHVRTEAGLEYVLWDLYCDLNKEYNIQTIYKYEHGGVAYNTGGFSCSWDSGRAGFIVSKFSYETQDSIVREYSNWANGEVYGFTVEDDDGEVIESCGGFIGEWDDVAEWMNDHCCIEGIDTNSFKEAFEQGVQY